MSWYDRCFNPRARVGRDVVNLNLVLRLDRFQSARPRGARLPQQIISQQKARFQSARPRGARRTHSGTGDRFYGRFNPRARVGRDMGGLSSVAGVWVSFNPRARVGRDFGMDGWNDIPVETFQSARPRGARQWKTPNQYAGSKFQSARPRGARPQLCHGQHCQ